MVFFFGVMVMGTQVVVACEKNSIIFKNQVFIFGCD
jgi:hypothetical protein